MPIHDELLSRFYASLGIKKIDLRPDVTYTAEEVKHIVDTAINELFIPCSTDRDLQPVAFGLCVGRLAEVLGVPLKVAALLLETSLQLLELKRHG